MKGSEFLAGLGAFRVVGKENIRPFSRVSELREIKVEEDCRRLVYEGISDDGKTPFVEFGQVINMDRTLSYLLFLYWCPPSPVPADAVEGILKFAPTVTSVENVPIPESDTVIPRTRDYSITLADGTKLRLRAVGLEPDKTRIAKNDGRLEIRFQETRSYDPGTASGKNRTDSYVSSATDSHFITFTFSLLGQ